MNFCGIDWSKESFQICIIDERGEIVEEFSIEKSPQEFSTFLQRVRKFKEIEFSIERKDSPLVDLLLYHGYRVYCLNPNSMPSYRALYKSSKVKDDVLDAFVIAQALRLNKSTLSEIKRMPEEIERIKILWKDMNSLLKEKGRLENKLGCILIEYYPEFFKCFNELSRGSLRFLIQYPEPDSARRLSMEELRQFFRSCHIYDENFVKRVWNGLREEEIKVRSIIVETKKRMAVILARQLLGILEGLDEYERKLAEKSEEIEGMEFLEGIKGIGLWERVGVMVYFNHREWKDFKEAQSASGMVPVTMKSGNFLGIHFRIGCIKWGRALFTQIAYTTLSHQPWARLYYNRKRKEGKTHYHALRCLGNIWVKILFTLWKKGERYNHEKYYIAMTEPLLREANVI